MLKIDNLHATVGGTEILRGLSLEVSAGEVHAIMGPNGAGKSTLAYVLGGRPGYEVTAGSVTFMGEDLLALAPHERAAAGLFLGFQYPVEIPGVSNVQFLREALNAQRKARGEEPLSGGEFLKLAREKAGLLKLDMEMMKRAVNVGFSGGEKKRAEMVQMGILDPAFAVLDETDSGLDIDALKVVADGGTGHNCPVGANWSRNGGEADRGRTTEHPCSTRRGPVEHGHAAFKTSASPTVAGCAGRLRPGTGCRRRRPAWRPARGSPVRARWPSRSR